ncbi:MAG: DUF3500 domain-containing protein [Chitinophagaceae bacterium]
MNRFILLIGAIVYFSTLVTAQDLVGKTNAFIKTLSASQKTKALYPFDTAERYRFMYVPLDDRKGISMNELDDGQRSLVMDLLKTSLAEETIKKMQAIMLLDNVLKEMEHRKPEDRFRDPRKYFLTIFGIPSAKTIWGWRFEGHHIAFHFSANKKELVAGTPSFLGSNPAIVLQGPQKGENVLKDETDKGFAMLHALSPDELKKAIIDTTAPAEIITGAKRKAMIANPAGVRYSELSPAHQQLLLQLLSLYIHRYTKLFADNMLKEIQTAGLNNLWFSWAGYTEPVLGKPYYYRIQGPSIIIEYDNTQNNANHIHTVIRDLNNDFGGDLLLQHYKENH